MSYVLGITMTELRQKDAEIERLKAEIATLRANDRAALEQLALALGWKDGGPGWQAAIDEVTKLARLTPSGQVADDLEVLTAMVKEWAPDSDTRSRRSVALSRLTAQAQGYEAMKAERDALKAKLEVVQREHAEASQACTNLAERGDYWKVRAEQAETERDAAVADNAALCQWIDDHGHARWCEREADKKLRCTEQCKAARVLSQPSTGAALLAEHAKALVRARTEVAQRAYDTVFAIWGDAARAQQVADEVLKEPEL